jgi:hypothetical protein
VVVGNMVLVAYSFRAHELNILKSIKILVMLHFNALRT